MQQLGGLIRLPRTAPSVGTGPPIRIMECCVRFAGAHSGARARAYTSSHATRQLHSGSRLRVGANNAVILHGCSCANSDAGQCAAREKEGKTDFLLRPRSTEKRSRQCPKLCKSPWQTAGSAWHAPAVYAELWQKEWKFSHRRTTEQTSPASNELSAVGRAHDGELAVSWRGRCEALLAVMCAVTTGARRHCQKEART